jgi:acetyl-CoA synthetase
VAFYMPLVPELAIAMLACARIGAVHSVVFGGFSAESLRDRINDAQAKVLVTADGGYRRGASCPSSRWPTKRSRKRRASSTSWSCGAATATSRCT